MDEGLEDEVINLRRMLESVQRNQGLDQNFKSISKFDILSLHNVEKTIEILMDKRVIKDYPKLRSFLMTPEQRGEEERKNEERERRRQRREERKDMTDLERLFEKQGNLGRACRGFMDYLNYGENERTTEIPFQEPVPGCKYNITTSMGSIIISLKETTMSNFLKKSQEYLNNIAHQLFDGIGKRISMNLISVSEWTRTIHEGDGNISYEIEVHTHNTKFRSFISRNQIEEKIEEIISMLLGKMMIPQGKSGFSFKEGILIRVEYYANLSNEKKKKSGKNKSGK